MNLETFDSKTFSTICPGKQMFFGQKHIIETLTKSAEILGKNYVFSIFVGGLERIDSLKRGMKFLAERNVRQGEGGCGEPGADRDVDRCQPVDDSSFSLDRVTGLTPLPLQHSLGGSISNSLPGTKAFRALPNRMLSPSDDRLHRLDLRSFFDAHAQVVRVRDREA